MKCLLVAIAVFLGVPLAAHAEGEQCFRTHNVEGFAPTDDEQHLYLRDSSRHYFRLDFANRCTGLAFRERIVIRPFGTSDLVCGPADMDFSLRQSGIETKCVISEVHALSPEETKALPKKLRP